MNDVEKREHARMLRQKAATLRGVAGLCHLEKFGEAKAAFEKGGIGAIGRIAGVKVPIELESFEAEHTRLCNLVRPLTPSEKAAWDLQFGDFMRFLAQFIDDVERQAAELEHQLGPVHIPAPPCRVCGRS